MVRGSLGKQFKHQKDIEEALFKGRKAICKGLKMQKVNTRYILSANSNNKKGREVLITNY